MNFGATSTAACPVTESYVAETFVCPKSTDVTIPALSTVATAASALVQVTEASSIVSPLASITVAVSVVLAPIVLRTTESGSTRIRLAPGIAGSVGSSEQAWSSRAARRMGARTGAPGSRCMDRVLRENGAVMGGAPSKESTLLESENVYSA